ncbi:MAG: conserved membrane protein of unknown function [Promethearchaeota archaeon]|nr:MAG: conserved membrane protein of unknown function [Candidatus Lokiarchaeota archaeon]
MSIWLIFFVLLVIIFIPLHFVSVSHIWLNKQFGEEKGALIGKLFGFLSGWGFFICLFGIWLSPQPRFQIPFLISFTLNVPILDLEILLIHFIASSPLIIISVYLGIFGVKETSLKVSETHRTDKIIKTGLYSKIRHPQYLGAIFAHIGFSILFAGTYSLILSILVIFYNYITAWKEEKELVKEFGEEYKTYKERVPMFIPKF